MHLFFYIFIFPNSLLCKKQLNTIKFSDNSLINIRERVIRYYDNITTQMKNQIKGLTSDKEWINNECEKTELIQNLQNYAFSDDFTKKFTVFSYLFVNSFEKIKKECLDKALKSRDIDKLSKYEFIDFYADLFYNNMIRNIKLARKSEEEFFFDFLIKDMQKQKIKYFFGLEPSPKNILTAADANNIKQILIQNVENNIITISNLADPEDFIRILYRYAKKSYSDKKRNICIINLNTDILLFNNIQNDPNFSFDSFITLINSIKKVLEENITLCDEKTWKDDIQKLSNDLNTSFMITKKKTIYLDYYFEFLKTSYNVDLNLSETTNVLFELQTLITSFMQKLFEKVINEEHELHFTNE